MTSHVDQAIAEALTAIQGAVASARGDEALVRQLMISAKEIIKAKGMCGNKNEGNI